MQNITPFQFEAHQLRVITDDQGTPWFNATDVCDALDIANPSQAIKSHVDAEDLQKLETLILRNLDCRQSVASTGPLLRLRKGSAELWIRASATATEP